ncbi:MAG: response regulator [Gammaproteobacteria bacterium]|nr:response regulator [Gammaproteobacteria bacterium]
MNDEGLLSMVDDSGAGLRFLDDLLQRLLITTGADQVLVGNLSEDGLRVGVQRLLVAGKPVAMTEYLLIGTPCEKVFESELSVIADGVAERFPDDAMLAEAGIEGYAGIRLIGEGGSSKGILVLLFERPIRDVDGVADTLERAAPRVTLELERLRYEQRLAQSEQRYRALVETSLDGVLVHRNFDLLYVNPAAARLVGYESSEALLAVGSALELLPPEERALAHERVAARRRDEHVERDYDMDVLHRDGRRIRLRTLVSQVEWDGEPAWQVVVTDASERTEADERAAQALRLESIGKLTGGIAHDFNNLLAVVLGNLELIDARITEPKTRELLRQASAAAERGSELTRRLLSFARRQPLQPVAVLLEDLLAETRSMLAMTLRPEIELHVEQQLRVPVLADPTQLQMALLNLANNAQDAILGPGSITIRTSQQAPAALRGRFRQVQAVAHACIEVVDTGVGMPPEVRDRAFEPFFSTKQAVQGSGLGLSMVHGFVRQSRGHIELDSAEGEGTCIRIYLPLAPSEVRASLLPEAAQQTAKGQGRILVVEDEPSVREVTVAMLRSFGYEVFAAADGSGARNILAQEQVDLLLSDVVLPGERGPEIAAEVLERKPELRVMFMSGYTDTEVFQSFPDRGRVRLLQKPFRRETLRVQVAEVLAEAATGTATSR